VELLAQSTAIKSAEESLRADVAELEKTVTQVARGEWSVRAQITHPMLTPLIEAFNALADNYARRMERVRAASADIASAASQVQAVAGDMVSGAERQEQAAIDATAAVADLSGSTQQVAVHADAATEAARKALELSEQGSRAVRETADGMQHIRSSMQATAAKIKSLGDRSLEIYEIINLIHETNLLALSAVVESSRGGPAGQTLDVLSTELKKLADHSRSATRDIVTLLKSIQGESNEAVAVMEQGNRVAETGSKLAEQASRAFAGIAEVLKQTSESAEAIAAASRDQVDGTERVANAVQEIAAQVRQSSASSRQSAKIVEQAARSSEQVMQLVAPPRPAAVPTVVKPEKAEKGEALPAAVGERGIQLFP
jgi:twitching motility protein PilJ